MGLVSGGYNNQHMTKPFYKILSRARKKLLKENIDFGYISKNNNGFRSQLYAFESTSSRLKQRLFGKGNSTYVGEFYLSENDETFDMNIKLKNSFDEEIKSRFEKSLDSILSDIGKISIE